MGKNANLQNEDERFVEGKTHLPVLNTSIHGIS